MITYYGCDNKRTHSISATKDVSNRYAVSYTAQDTVIFESGEHPISVSELYFNRNKNIIYAIDKVNYLINIYNDSGKIIRQFGGAGQGPGKFVRINGFTIESNGNLLISDSGLRRVSEFDSSGMYIQNSGSFNEQYFTDDCELQIYQDSILYVGLMDPFNYLADRYTKSFLFVKFSFPEWKELQTGGYYDKIYNQNMTYVMGRSFLITDDGFYYVQMALPYITRLDKNLNFVGVYGITGKNFKRIMKGFDGEINFANIKKLSKYVNGKSFMLNIIPYQNYIVCIYRTDYRKEIYGRLIYQDKSGKDNEFRYQLYSEDLMNYYGEVLLPGRYMGSDEKYIYSRIITDENKELYVKYNIYVSLINNK